jgi:hypothetical protein
MNAKERKKAKRNLLRAKERRKQEELPSPPKEAVSTAKVSSAPTSVKTPQEVALASVLSAVGPFEVMTAL